MEKNNDELSIKSSLNTHEKFTTIFKDKIKEENRKKIK